MLVNQRMRIRSEKTMTGSHYKGIAGQYTFTVSFYSYVQSIQLTYL